MHTNDETKAAMNLPTLLDARTLAASGKLPGMTEVAIRQAARTGVLPSVRLGRKVWFNLDELRVFLQAGGRALPGGWRREPAAPVAGVAGGVVVRRRRGRPRRAEAQDAPGGAGAE